MLKVTQEMRFRNAVSDVLATKRHHMACFRLIAFYTEFLYCINNLLVDQMSNVRIINNVCLLALLINNNIYRMAHKL